MINSNLQEKKIIAKNWFETLRNSICREFERIEYLKSKKKILFKKNKWIAGGSSKGGGIFALIENGSVFEKVGVNISTISGKFDKEFRKKIPGALNNHNFWATGISVVAHMKNPKIPAFHFNTRFIVTSKSWFGGGMDMTSYYKRFKSKKIFSSRNKDKCVIFIIRIIIFNIKKIVINIFIYPTDKSLEEMVEYFMIILIPITGIKILITPEMLE